jgi:hypothetical protein
MPQNTTCCCHPGSSNNHPGICRGEIWRPKVCGASIPTAALGLLCVPSQHSSCWQLLYAEGGADGWQGVYGCAADSCKEALGLSLGATGQQGSQTAVAAYHPRCIVHNARLSMISSGAFRSDMRITLFVAATTAVLQWHRRYLLIIIIGAS